VVEGTCADEFGPLRELLEKNLASGVDTGAGVAVVQDGDLVVDLWGGEARPEVPWTRDTIANVWSVSKTMVALVVLTQVERGLIDPDAPVTEYWPAFGAHDKDKVLVRHVLGHSSGVPGWTPAVTCEDICDLEKSEAILADQEPWYEAGSAPAYHMINHGHLLDGIVRGATGRPLAEILHSEITGPLGGGFWLGVPEDELDLCADQTPPPGTSVDYSGITPDHFLIRTVFNPLLTPDFFNSTLWRTSAVGGCGGHGNARGVARAQALLSHGGEYGGLRLLSPETIARVFEVQAEGSDLTLAVPTRFGMGYALQMSSAPAIHEGRVCWWTGYGGAIVVNDLDRRTTFAYTPNKLADHVVASPRTDEYVTTAFGCLD